MDAADYSKERYDEIVKSTSPCLKNLGYNPAKIPFVPISGLEGDNQIERSNNLPWYEGPTLLEALHQIQDPKTPSDKSLEKKEHPNGGKSIKSAAMRRGKKFGTAIVNGGKKICGCYGYWSFGKMSSSRPTNSSSSRHSARIIAQTTVDAKLHADFEETGLTISEMQQIVAFEVRENVEKKKYG
ncbi:hypothetical protein FEM48_Zijuj07G0061700 [Ziziphus jujuba var. spinosa]|uniref:Elongation factor 1-alpha-like n=1 Tax=Ziziphus jujuba var. spinosa TaxID=714518 RepID=A0A978V2X8_ZIZJJ|nr:hypothetical protein FEM48_Zijuj07G0061700 [Ziziphus jujuba var. spinosa]